MSRRERFHGAIAGAGSSSGVRLVVGRWAESPLGAFADVMVETAEGHRVLLAPSEEVARFVATTYVFDEVRVQPVEVLEGSGCWTVRAPDLQLELGIGGRTLLGRLLRLVPTPVATAPIWCAAIDPVVRVVLRGVRTRGSARNGRREWYGAHDVHAVTHLVGSLEGRDLGRLAPVDPPARFGFSSTPRRPCLTSVVTTVATQEPPAADADAPDPVAPRASVGAMSTSEHTPSPAPAPAPSPAPVVVVTGANGLVGARTCAALVERGASVRAVVRRAGAAPRLDGVEERVGDFADHDLAADVVAGASAVVTTVHPMGSSREVQHRVGVEGTPVIARAARDAGVPRLVHMSTAGVYDRSPGVGDVDESSALVGPDANAYAATKRDTDAALAEVDGLTRVLVRPPAILGPGETSVWNTLRPAEAREDEQARHAVPEQTFAWVHVDDLAAFLADVATGAVAPGSDPEAGPVEGGCTVVNLAAGPATIRDYLGTVTRGLGVDPVWEDGPAWTGQVLADRARGWGWKPRVDLAAALAEIEAGLRAEAPGGS